MSDKGIKPKAAAQLGGGESSERNEEGLVRLAAALSEYLDSYVALAQLHGQRCLLSLCKIFLLWIASLVLLLATWCSLLFAVFEIAVQMGAQPALAMLLVAFSHLLLACWCWRRLCSRVQGLIPRSAVDAVDARQREVCHGN